MAKKDDLIGVQYMGEGAWIPGVPARDLTIEEFSTHKSKIEACEAATKTTLYAAAAHKVTPTNPPNHGKGT